jgi:hypothetical protein
MSNSILEDANLVCDLVVHWIRDYGQRKTVLESLWLGITAQELINNSIDNMIENIRKAMTVEGKETVEDKELEVFDLQIKKTRQMIQKLIVTEELLNEQ